MAQVFVARMMGLGDFCLCLSSNRAKNSKHKSFHQAKTSISGAATANYTYDANGDKLKSLMGGVNRDYVDGTHYEDEVLKFITTETGRAVRIGNTQNYSYEHNLTDHLGNVRVTIDDQGNNVARVVQENEYYAFGLVKPGGYLFGDKNNYLYNGKELQDGLGQYDYGARF